MKVDPISHSQNQSSAVVEAALFYNQLGWEPLVLPPQEKSPKGKWKQPRSWSSDQIAHSFFGNVNIGIALGKRSKSLVDIDFDCPETAALAYLLFPHLPAFGRASSRASHRVLYCEIQKGRVTYQVPDEWAKQKGINRSMLLEIRGDGHQTMFPPSVHPSGEVVSWESGFDAIPTLPPDELIKHCGLLALLAVVAMAYPDGAGQRDEICMILCGVLIRAGLSDDLVNALTEKVALLGGDEEAAKRTGKAAATRERLESGRTTWGLPELCERLGLQELQKLLRSWLGQSSVSPVANNQGNRAQIFIQGGNLPAEVDAAETALLGANLGVYQRGESLVRVVRLPPSEGDDGVVRPSGALLIYGVTSAWLKENFARVADWYFPSDAGGKPTNPPAVHVSAYLARIGEWKAPVLRGVVSCPTMRADGTVLQVPGFDPQSGLLYEPGGLSFPMVPDNPSQEKALLALEELYRPFRAYVFPTAADRSVLLAACLTAVTRRVLPSAPLFAVDAPTAGSGKTLLCETIGAIAAGYKPTLISQGKTPEEDEKRLSSVLMAGDAVLVIDNCERPLGGDTLCSMLTQEFISARVLGKSEVKRLPTNALVMATGNNLEVIGDLGRRTLVCRIDTGQERPDQVSHGFSPVNEALLNRPALVVAALTVLRAYIAAGKPYPLTPIGSFEDWNFIREALVWLGEHDPIVTRERVVADDPRKGDLSELLILWREALGGRSVTLAELGAEAARNPRGKVGELHQALAERTPKGHFNPRSVGRLLARHKDRVVAGRVLYCTDDPSGMKRYRVDEVGVTEAPDDTPF